MKEVQNLEKIKGLISTEVEKRNPEEALKFLFELDAFIYLHEGAQSIRYGNGVHTKHRHINYHKFFTDNIESGETVLDIGCSTGENTSDIAKKANPGEVVGIEIEGEKLEIAKDRYKHQENLTFIEGDATKDLPGRTFDVITLSNVLEHIEKREELLQKLIKKYNPQKVIIRVPLFERDWRVPLKKELGLDYRLDDTHYIEYTKEIFEQEMEDSSLKIDMLDIRWGEIWAVLFQK